MVSTPSSFILPKPLDQTSAPAPSPPAYLKHQVYDDPHVFEKVDYHAIRVARNSYPTFRDLLWDLVFRYKLNDLEKARVIFRWMTSCDMNTLNFQTVPKNSPEEVLLSLKDLKGSYANALELMCSYSGLYCLTISGYAKGVDYRPGDIFKEQAFNHSWNVLYIQDSWQLIDAHWATRYLTARKNTQDSIVYQYDDFYFIMEPQQAVYSHFPQDIAWQLLKEPLTLNQFENLPLTKSQFFKCGMDFHNQHHGVVHSKDGNLKMTLGFWKPDSFTYKLVTDKNSDVFDGVSLKYFVIQETVNNQLNFYFRFPAAGNYYLTVFVQELNEHNVPVNQENIFRAACEYKIVADKAASNSLPYPMSCHDLNWGPQWSLVSHYNLVPVQEDGVISIKSPDNKPFVQTEIKFGKTRDDVGLLCKLRKNGVEDEDILDQYIEILEKPDQTVFILNLPEPGEYGLEIYANEPSEGDTFTHVCQYLLDFEPPPGYKPQSSVFGPLGVGSKMVPLEPSNIREMYNYEKDASPMGALPKPYMLSQYSPEDVTMIPGLSKNKPKPFAYNQTNKPDESDMEMPDFLPPPPPVNVIPEKSSSSAAFPPSGGTLGAATNGLRPQPPSSDDLSNQLNQSSRPLTGTGNRYSPQNQSMAPGEKMNQAPYKTSNPTFGQPNSSDNLVNKYNTATKPVPGTNQYSPQNQSMVAGDSGAYPTFPPPPPPPSDALINELNTTLRSSGGPSQYVPQNQSMTPGDRFSQGPKKGDNYASLQAAKPFTKSYIGDTSNVKVGDSVYHGEKTDEELMEETVRLQPYLASVEKGMSPQLSRQVHDYSGKNKGGDPKLGGVGNARNSTNLPGSTTGGGDLSQSRSFDSSNVSDPSLVGAKDNSSNETTRPSVFRGYGRPNFSSVQTDGVNATVVPGQYQTPSQSAGLQQPGTTQTPVLQKQGLFKDDTANKFIPSNIAGSYTVAGMSDPQGISGVLPFQMGFVGERVDNRGDLDKSKPNKIFGKNSQNAPLGGTNIQSRNPNESSGGGIPSAPYGVRSATDSQYKATLDPGFVAGSYGVRGAVGDPRKDSTKISNIAVTLSPSGFKKPQPLENTSDQYNNQYEDSSKIMPSPIQKYRPDESTANWTSGPVQKEPPKNFQPTPIAVEEVVYKPEVEALPREAPVSSTLSPEETCKIFQRIDDHAMQVSAQHQDSFNQLIWQLIYARNITDELEKVRVIFLWLCTKDLHKMNFDDIKKDSPEEILMGLKSGKSTYAQIFLTLCRYAGLHCKLIVGYAKGADYVPGMQFQGRHGEHSWNAVLISGVWRLVDCHWAARRLIGKERKPENVRYELDMFYFLANPSQLIYTHFPHEQDWQLLHHPINIEEFESLAPVKSMFFKYNLDLVTHKNAVINSTTPEFELRIAFPKGVEERLLFTFTLTLNDGSEDYKGVSLLRYGRQEIDYISNHSSFWIRAPAPGSYKLLLFAKLNSTDQSSSDSSSQNMFGAICEYKIEFDFAGRHVLSPFPPCQTSTYGPSEVYKRYAIESCMTKSSIFTENGSVELKFLIHKPDIRVMAKLITSSGKNSDQITEQCVLQRLVGSEEAVMNVFLPEAGEYGLEVYANDSRKDGNSFYTVWQYFLETSSASIVNGLPSLPPGYMGPYEPKFTNYGLSTYSHKDPFIVAKTGDLCIQLKTTREKPVRIMTQLIHCSHNVSEMCPNQVLQQSRDSIVYFLVRFPHQGFFKLQIFALPYSEMSESLPGVFNYLIESNHSSSQKVLEFPQQFAQWKEGCYLYEPTDGILGLNSRPEKVTFKMDVPRATGMAVVVNNEWTRLEKDSGGCWTADVAMKDVWGRKDVDQLTVCANYGMSLDDSFTTILKYSLQ